MMFLKVMAATFIWVGSGSPMLIAVAVVCVFVVLAVLFAASRGKLHIPDTSGWRWFRLRWRLFVGGFRDAQRAWNAVRRDFVDRVFPADSGGRGIGAGNFLLSRSARDVSRMYAMRWRLRAGSSCLRVEREVLIRGFFWAY